MGADFLSLEMPNTNSPRGQAIITEVITNIVESLTTNNYLSSQEAMCVEDTDIYITVYSYLKSLQYVSR